MKIYSLKERKNLNIDKIIINTENIRFIKYGKSNVMIVSKNDEILVYGENKFGQLGTGNYQPVTSLLNINNSLKINFLECGHSFTVILNDENKFYMSGVLSYLNYSNYFSELEINVKKGENIKFIRAGRDCFFVIATHSLYAIGNNRNGKLGLRQNIKGLEFLYLIEKNLEIKDLQCGLLHTILLDRFGQIYVTGSNICGQLGIGDSTESIYKFTKLDFSFKIKQIACGPNSSLFLTEYNELIVTGMNVFGELGVNDCNNRYVFTKVNFADKQIKNICKSFGNYNLLTTFENNLYISGKIFNNNINTTFTKLDINPSKRYSFPFCLEDDIVIVECDYNLNYEEDEVLHQLGNKCLQKVQNSQLVDIALCFENI